MFSYIVSFVRSSPVISSVCYVHLGLYGSPNSPRGQTLVFFGSKAILR